MTDIKTESGIELFNFTEIVNDILHSLHLKDREVLTSTPLMTVLSEMYEWRSHIRNFYNLDNPLHPFHTSEFKTDESIDAIITAVCK